MILVVFPLHLIEFLLEGVVRLRLLKNFWKIVCDVDIEISPMELINDVVLRAKFLQSSFISLSNRDGCKVKISSQASARN